MAPLSSTISHSGSRNVWIKVALIVVVGAAAYATSFLGAFQFDDIPAILENPTISRLWPISLPLNPPAGALTVSGRPLLNLSFAFNHTLSGNDVWSYHLLNLAIHLSCALVLFGIIRRTWKNADWAAAAVAVLWVVHPLTTESVTYVVQRAESLMALFYLLTLYFFIRGLLSSNSGLWKLLSVIACLFGVATKEVAVSAPVAVLLYDRAFCGRSWGEVWRRSWGAYLGLFATWIPLAWLVVSIGGTRGNTVGFEVGVSWVGYWISQGEAAVRYIGLTFWPHPLVLEYGHASAPLALALSFCAAVVALFAATVVGSVRGKPWAFPFALCFLILAPTSLIPGVLQFMAEHRFYLPMAGIIAVAVALARATVAKWDVPQTTRSFVLVAASVVLTVGLTAATTVRNLDYRNDLSLWLDSIARRPDSALAQANVGYALLSRGRTAEALAYCEASVRLDPLKATPHFNLGMAYETLNRPEEALVQFATAAQMNPKLFTADFRAGRLLDRLGRPTEAEGYLRQALVGNPNDADTHGSLGVALSALNRPDEAIAEYEESLRLRPDQPEVEFNLGVVFARLGRLSEAQSHYARAVALKPTYGEAQMNLGVALAQEGHSDQALLALKEAAHLMPESAQAHANLAAALDESGLLDEAIAEYRRAIELRPNYPEASFNLARALSRRVLR